MKVIKKLILNLIRFYQLGIAPLFLPACRFVPSCSDYMAIAISEKGILKGIGFGFKRLCRCHPFQQGGFDPVPVKE